MFLGRDIFWALLRAHFNPSITAGAKIRLSRAQKILVSANINSIVLLPNKRPLNEWMVSFERNCDKQWVSETLKFGTEKVDKRKYHVKFGFNTTGLSQLQFRNLSACSINVVIDLERQNAYSPFFFLKISE